MHFAVRLFFSDFFFVVEFKMVVLNNVFGDRHAKERSKLRKERALVN
jgi:hypothetical protein